MTAEPRESETQTEVPIPAPSEETEAKKEKPLFDLGDLLRRRGKGEAIGFWETLAYMDYQDRKDERAYRREQATSPRTPTSSPEVESLKKDVTDLRQTVSDMLEIIRSKEAKEAQEKFVDGVVKQTTSQILPEINKIASRLEALEQQTTTQGATPEATSELTEIKESIKQITDKLGEKLGTSGKTVTEYVNDIDKLIGIVETIEKRFRRGEGGEVDYKTMAVSTVGEIGKELITAYREIETSKTGATGSEAPKVETPASTMQTVIKRQVQNYITQRMEAGATKMNIQEAANELGLTPGQVQWAYETLMKEGWFHVRIPSKPKRKVKETETIQPEETETQTPSETEEEQVFRPPVET